MIFETMRYVAGFLGALASGLVLFAYLPRIFTHNMLAIHGSVNWPGFFFLWVGITSIIVSGYSFYWAFQKKRQTIEWVKAGPEGQSPLDILEERKITKISAAKAQNGQRIHEKN